MDVIDPFDSPSGKEVGTQRPVWKVRLPDGQIWWAYLQRAGRQLTIVGYSRGQIIETAQTSRSTAGAIVGAGAGALLGAAIGGGPGAMIGGVIGAVLFASGSNQRTP